MAAFLDLLARKKLSLDPIIGETVPFEQAPEAYTALREGRAGLAILFKYAQSTGTRETTNTVSIPATSRSAKPAARIVLGCIGVGNYANTKLLPVLAKRPDVRLNIVATTRGTTGKTAAERFGFQETTTDSSRIFDDPDINTVLIATPHSSHARLVCAALSAGKHVIVEKPLCLNEQELSQIVSAYSPLSKDSVTAQSAIRS